MLISAFLVSARAAPSMLVAVARGISQAPRVPFHDPFRHFPRVGASDRPFQT
jgi:hypothetical protein